MCIPSWNSQRFYDKNRRAIMIKGLKTVEARSAVKEDF